MTATAHALIAGAIATRFPDPILAGLLSFTSHFIIDSIPHWDFGTDWRARSKVATGVFAVAETVTGITIAYMVYRENVPFAVLAIAIASSLVPDWLETPWYIFFAHKNKSGPTKRAGIWEKLSFAVYKIENHFHTKANLPLGMITQIATVGFFLLLLRS